MSVNEIGSAFWKTLSDSSALEVVADVGEVGLDTFLNGPLKDVPVFGMVLKLWKAGGQINDLIFLSKLIRFLKEIQQGNPVLAPEYSAKMEKDDDSRKKISSIILIAVDRLDDVEKAELLARAFKLLSTEDINYDTFREYIFSIDRCLLSDLKHMVDSEKVMELVPSVATRLSSCGLIELHAVPTIRADGDEGNHYHMTSLGRGFVRYLSARND